MCKRLLKCSSFALPSLYQKYPSCENGGMKPNLRVLKWIGTVPAVGVCTGCDLQFKVPTTTLKRVADAQESLREQFVEHRCPQPDRSEVD
jgi:hypothetical protein